MPKKGKGRCDPPTLHVYDRRRIMARAWTLSRQRGIALGAAQKLAWAEAKAGNCTDIRTTVALADSRGLMPTTIRLADARGGALSHSSDLRNAIVLRHHGALVPLRRRLGRVLPLLINAARWLESRFIPSRAA